MIRTLLLLAKAESVYIDLHRVRLNNVKAKHGYQFVSEVDKWREWFMKQHGDVRDAFIELGESSTHLISIFLSAYLKPGIDPHTGGIFIDIGLSKHGRVTAAGATFCKSSAALHVSRSLILFNYDAAKRSGKIIFSGENKRLSESTEGLIEYEIEKDVFRLIDLDTSLLFWDWQSKNYIPVMQWDMNAYTSAEFEVLCNGCFGEGTSKRMSISKADYESGLTGYALYSSNQINGTYGCEACGGGGAKYEEWYLKENPSLSNAPEHFHKGWGTFSQNNITEVEIHVR